MSLDPLSPSTTLFPRYVLSTFGLSKNWVIKSWKALAKILSLFLQLAAIPQGGHQQDKIHVDRTPYFLPLNNGVHHALYAYGGNQQTSSLGERSSSSNLYDWTLQPDHHLAQANDYLAPLPTLGIAGWY